MNRRELKDHVNPAEVINLFKLKERMPLNETIALCKTDSMEIIRMVLPAGKAVREHQVAGEITVQCLEGEVDFEIEGKSQRIVAGDWLYLNGHQRHALTAVQNSVVLVTILVKNN